MRKRSRSIALTAWIGVIVLGIDLGSVGIVRIVAFLLQGLFVVENLVWGVTLRLIAVVVGLGCRRVHVYLLMSGTEWESAGAEGLRRRFVALYFDIDFLVVMALLLTRAGSKH